MIWSNNYIAFEVESDNRDTYYYVRKLDMGQTYTKPQPHIITQSRQLTTITTLVWERIIAYKCNVDIPNVVTYLNRILIFEWYVVWCDSKNGYQNDMY
jgi:hypothetical protein